MSLTKDHMFAEEERKHLEIENSYLARQGNSKRNREILWNTRLILVVVAITSLFLLNAQ